PRSKSSVSTVIARPRVPSVQFLVIAGSNTAGIALCFWNRQKDTSKTHKNRCGGNAAEGGFLGTTREPADCSSEVNPPAIERERYHNQTCKKSKNPFDPGKASETAGFA